MGEGRDGNRDGRRERDRERDGGERRVRERDEDDRPRERDADERGGGGRRGERDYRERDRGGDRERDRGDRERDRGGDRERDRGDRGGDRDRHRDRGDRGDRDRDHRDGDRHRSKRASSPVRMEPRKRKTNWDQPPSLDGMGMDMGVDTSGVPVPVDRQSRRLYVGNIPTGVTEAEIQDFFNTALITAKAVARAGNPVIAVQINVAKNYAFIEMRAPDEANAGMAFDGIMLHGQALKIRRPVDFIPAASYDKYGNRPSLPAGAIVATNVLDSPFKIYIGGLPANLDEPQVKELLQTFGPLKAFNLVKDIGTGLSKGFAFCEYLDVSVTDRACTGLNGMRLGDKQLLVQRAALGAKNPLQSMGMLAPPPVSIPSGPLTASAANILNLAIPAVTLLSSITPPQNQQIKSRILCLVNLISLEDVDDEDEFTGVVEDVRDECLKFGPIKQVVIPRPKRDKPEETKKDEYFEFPSANDYSSPNAGPYSGGNALVSLQSSNGSDLTPAQQFQQQIEKLKKQQDMLKPKEHVCSLGKVYVEYIQYEDCLQALHQLAGRRYNGHVVITSLFPEGLFFSGCLF